MNKFNALILVVLILFAFGSDGESLLEKAHSKELTVLTYEECKKFIGIGGFRSKEELLQLFYNAYFSGKVKNIRVDRNETGKIGKAITTLFPIKHCDSIISFDTTLLLIFDKPQNVTVPGTYGQAHLEMSKQLGFNLEVDPNNQNVLKFKIIEGYVNLRISKLLQLFNNSMGNMDGSELFYFLNAKEKVSVMGLNEYVDIARKNIALTGDTSVIFIDLDSKKFKEKNDIVVKKDELRFFNISFSLNGTDSISYNDSPWKRDSVSAMQIRYTIDAIRKGFVADTLFPGGLRVNKTAVCQLEKKRISLSTGFNLIK